MRSPLIKTLSFLDSKLKRYYCVYSLFQENQIFFYMMIRLRLLWTKNIIWWMIDILTIAFKVNIGKAHNKICHKLIHKWGQISVKITFQNQQSTNIPKPTSQTNYILMCLPFIHTINTSKSKLIRITNESFNYYNGTWMLNDHLKLTSIYFIINVFVDEIYFTINVFADEIYFIINVFPMRYILYFLFNKFQSKYVISIQMSL